MKINELKPGMRQVDIEGKIVKKGEPRQIQTRLNETSRLAEATLADDSGAVKMPLWNEQIDNINVGDEVRIEAGYVTSFRGETQLNAGRHGRLIPKQQPKPEEGLPG